MKNTTNTLNGSITPWKIKLIKVAQKLIFNSENFNDSQTNLNLLDRGIHLAIFSEPFLSLLLSGKKTFDSRFSINKNGPYLKVSPGDLVFIKRTGGEICGYFIVGKTFFFNHLSSEQIVKVKAKYEKSICSFAVDGFWEQRKDARFITLMEVEQVKKITPISIEKKDRTAWVILKASNKMQLDVF